MSLTIPSYPNTHIPTLADHLTRGLLSGLWEGRSFRVVNGKKEGMLAKPLPFHVTLLKVVCIATIIPIFVALYLNWTDQRKPPVLPAPTKKETGLPVPQDKPKAEAQSEEAGPTIQYGENIAKINQLPLPWIGFFMNMIQILRQGKQEPPEWTCYSQNQEYFGHIDNPDRLKPSDMLALWGALIKNIDKLKGKEEVEADYLITLVKGN